MSDLDIVALVGSLRAGSHNRRLAAVAARVAPEGVHVEELPLLEAPYHPDQDAAGAPAQVSQLRARLAAADGLLVVVPEYNGSLPGVLKNTIDWCSTPVGAAALTNMPALVIGTSTGQYGGIWAQDDARRILGIAGARVIKEGLALPRGHEAIGDDGTLSPLQTSRLADRMGDLAAEARRRRALREEPALAV